MIYLLWSVNNLFISLGLLTHPPPKWGRPHVPTTTNLYFWRKIVSSAEHTVQLPTTTTECDSANNTTRWHTRISASKQVLNAKECRRRDDRMCKWISLFYVSIKHRGHRTNTKKQNTPSLRLDWTVRRHRTQGHQTIRIDIHRFRYMIVQNESHYTWW